MIYVKHIQIPTLPTQKPRRLYVYLPRDYRRSETRYPVLYMFDGHNVFYDSHATFGKSWGMKEYLEKTGLPLIVVGIECNPEGFNRLSEYAPWDLAVPDFEPVPPIGPLPGLGKVTMDWIVGSLKPEIDRKYRTLPEREHTLIGGSSMGGLMALYAITFYNETFSRAAALSPCFWAAEDRFIARVEQQPLASPTRVYMDLGSAELDDVPGPKDQYMELMTGAMFDNAKALSKSGADVAVCTVPGAHHCEADWEKRIPVFMDYLLG